MSNASPQPAKQRLAKTQNKHSDKVFAPFNLDETYFAWIGTDALDGVFYYRIQSPVVLIEFDHPGSVIPVGSPGASRNHMHTSCGHRMVTITVRTC